MSTNTDVIIVGGGPVGLVIALMIARAGIKVTLVEANPEVIQSPRAMAYGPAAVYELERIGIAQECRDIGMEEGDYNVHIRWITIDGKVVASIVRPKGGYPPVICGQHKVAEVILGHLAKYPNAKLLWNHKLVAIKDHGDSVTAVCETENGEVEITAQYLVGSDGARSTVRKLIGCTFDGFTYDKMVVATNVYYPFPEYDYGFAQFIVHPEHFALVSLSLFFL
jgi:2-polyprenyl-6-methoxyphenol hydroxylase-like FAD-dependent oxidoreductase